MDPVAEREGFEPPALVGLPLSRRVHLSALPPFLTRSTLAVACRLGGGSAVGWPASDRQISGGWRRAPAVGRHGCAPIPARRGGDVHRYTAGLPRERCQSGRMGRPAKALTIARWSVGSNPTLSAPPPLRPRRSLVVPIGLGGACACTSGSPSPRRCPPGSHQADGPGRGGIGRRRCRAGDRQPPDVQALECRDRGPRRRAPEVAHPPSHVGRVASMLRLRDERCRPVPSDGPVGRPRHVDDRLPR